MQMSVAQFGPTPHTSFISTLPGLRVEQPLVDAEALGRSLRKQSEANAKAARLTVFLDLANSVASRLETDDLLREVVASAREVGHSDFALAGLLDSKTGRFEVKAFDLPAHMSLDEELDSSLAEILGNRVFSTGKPWVGKAEEFAEADTEEDPKWSAGFRNICALPLISREKVLGILALGKREEESYTQDEVDFLKQVSSLLALAIENAMVNSELRNLKDNRGKERVHMEDPVRSGQHFREIVGRSAALGRVLREVEVVSPTDSAVLIQGETGTGKELIARAIHNLSARRDRPFVKLNCAAIPSGLLESELFGHEKGAFTGAIMRKAGRFEVADKGTLFLDEVGDIPLEVQSKLLRVLQEQEFERLGSTRTQQVDVRVIAATHRDLKQMVKDGQFRSDLFYRLHVFPLLVPPLRERREDIPMLVRHYVDNYARRMNRRIETIPSRAMEVFASYPWPGNVRELQNFIERAVILSPTTALRPPLDELTGGNVSGPGPSLKAGTLEEVEREHVLRAIRDSNWVIGGPNGAAARLGMKRTTLTYRIRKLKIPCRPV
jgi:formate hydrogenlyase transcriptional activator